MIIRGEAIERWQQGKSRIVSYVGMYSRIGQSLKIKKHVQKGVRSKRRISINESSIVRKIRRSRISDNCIIIIITNTLFGIQRKESQIIRRGSIPYHIRRTRLSRYKPHSNDIT